MTFYVENESGYEFDFDIELIASDVAKTTLEIEQCPFSPEINLLITDNEGIREYNREYRAIDKETDVLSFPNLDFDEAGIFDLNYLENNSFDITNPETEQIILGDIIINYERVLSQAEAYGHSIKREFAFLVAHSMLHLCGYDHMTPDEAKVMEEKQESVLNKLGITRDSN